MWESSSSSRHTPVGNDGLDRLQLGSFGRAFPDVDICLAQGGGDAVCHGAGRCDVVAMAVAVGRLPPSRARGLRREVGLFGIASSFCLRDFQGRRVVRVKSVCSSRMMRNQGRNQDGGGGLLEASWNPAGVGKAAVAWWVASEGMTTGNPLAHSARFAAWERSTMLRTCGLQHALAPTSNRRTTGGGGSILSLPHGRACSGQELGPWCGQSWCTACGRGSTVH